MKSLLLRASVLLLSVLLSGVLFTGCEEEKKHDLNFIIIITDDLGYGDPGCYGNPVIETPNIDRLAAEGMRFTQFCSVSSVCSPARAGLLTGRYPVRFGMAGENLEPDSPYGLPDKEITIAEYLKEKGYVTACIGKWHLGTVHGSLPNDQGFDYFYGLPFTNDMSEDVKNKEGNYDYEFMLPLIEQTDTLELDPDQSLLTSKLTNKALTWLDENASKPFFLYFSHPMPHVPLSVSSEFKGKSRRGLYGDVLMELDHSVGELIEKLKEKGIDNKTVVMFTSDNGPWLRYREKGGSAGPLRSGKGSLYEGGFRVPFILWAPGILNPQGPNLDFMSALDIFPTIQGLEGEKIMMPGLDGRDLSKMITSDIAAIEKPFYYFSKNGKLSGVRFKKYKLIKNDHRTELYQIEHDPSEKYNLAARDTLILKELEILMKNFSNSLKR
jgi:arylsulfatase A-like enzyme